MKIKNVVVITMVILLFSTMIGIYARSTYTDSNKRSDALNDFAVAVIDDSIVDGQEEVFTDNIDNENIILAVRCEDTYLYRYGCVTQKVSVCKVFKGDDISIGDVFHLAKANTLISHDKDSYINGRALMNMGYVNEMIPGKLYLVFIDRKINTYGQDDIYIQNPNYIIAPIFCYDDITNLPIEIAENEGPYVAYEKVKNNEFFVSSDYSVNKIEELKKMLIEKYKI